MPRLRPQPKLYVGPSSIEGDGLFAEEFIKKDCLVRYYEGEYITKNEKDLRQKLYANRGIEKTYFFGMDDGWIIDATGKEGSDAKFINHSCAVSGMIILQKKNYVINLKQFSA